MNFKLQTDRCPCGELEDDCDCNWKQPASPDLQEVLREALETSAGASVTLSGKDGSAAS